MSPNDVTNNNVNPKGYLDIKQGKLKKPDPKLVSYVYKLVTDDSAYKIFKDDPKASIESSGLDPGLVIIDSFTEIVDQLRQRLKGRESIFDEITTMDESSSTQTHSRTNFDNSSSSFFKYESSLSFFSKRGTVTSNSTGENNSVNTDFKKDGEGFHPGDILEHEIGLIFFPNQPLVTHELIEKIREKMVEK